MNLLLLHPGEVDGEGRAALEGRRAQHAREVLKVQAGDTLRVGVRGGQLGTSQVLEQAPGRLVLQVTLGGQPPARPGLDLVLAIPRPKALKRVIASVASLGVDRVFLVNAARVEKSFFDSKVLAPEFLAELIDLGLEQARDTMPPTIELRERLKPFVEDELPALTRGATCLVPHPGAEAPLGPQAKGTRVCLAIGPDGGWVPFEVELLQKAGFVAVGLGERILKVEVAIPFAIGAVLGGR